MVLPRKIRQQIEKQDFDAVESAWLEISAEPIEDIGYFASVARALVGGGQSELAEMLLELLDEQLSENSQWDLRLELLRRTGSIQHGSTKLHLAILDTLRQVYSDTKSFEELVQNVGLDHAIGNEDKTWDKVRRLESLLRFDEGTIVYMQGKGVGRVVEINQKLDSFKVEIEGKGAMRVGFRAASKMLDPLADDHVLALKVSNPEALADMSPSELLAETLKGFHRPLTAAEVRDALVGIVPEKKWNSWWTTARRHPQIVASAEVRNGYQWVESSEDARGAIWKSFEGATKRVKLDLLRRSSSHDEKLRERMARVLERIGVDSLTKDPGISFEVWAALSRIGSAPENVPWAPEELVKNLADPLVLFSSLEGRPSKERSYLLIRELREDWIDLYERALPRESDAKLLTMIAGALNDESPENFNRAVRRCLAQPGRAAGFFVWVSEKASEDENLQELGGRLFKKILDALALEEIAPYRNRLLALCDSGGTLPRLLPRLDLASAKAAEQAVVRAVGLRRDQREALLNAIYMKFPELRQEGQTPLYALEASIRAKRSEFKRLLEEEIPTNRKAIEEARALGDLRENFEYKAARQRHEYLTALATALDADLSRSQVLDPSEIDASRVRIGTAVKLISADLERTITILGPWESSPEDNIVSYESDLARSLLGKRAGDEVDIGDQSTRIESIAQIDD